MLVSVSDGAEASRAIAEGADLIDVTALSGPAGAAIRAAVPLTRLWTGYPAAVDADAVAAADADSVAAADADAVAAADADAVNAGGVVAGAAAPPAASGVSPAIAAAVAAAAISTWLGAPVIRSRHVVAVRRAIDMTLSIAGDRLPELTTRGLA